MVNKVAGRMRAGDRVAGLAVRRRRSRVLAALLGSSALTGLAASDAAAQSLWTGTVSPSWTTPGNWSTNAVPTAADDVRVDSILINAPLISSGVAATSATGSIGFAPGSVGALTVDGAGATWTITGHLSVGGEGTGSLTIRNGGVVAADNVFLGDSPGGVGTAMVTGAGSLLTLTGDLSLGNAGAGGNASIGILTIANGATVSNVNANIGDGGGGEGTLTVTGAGSVWNNTGALRVGNLGNGTLNIVNGGTVTVANGTGALLIADNVSSQGVVNIGNGSAPGSLNAGQVQFGPGTGSLVFNHTSSAYQFAPDIVGAGEIAHQAGVTTFTGNDSGFSGTASITGGTVIVPTGALFGSAATNTTVGAGSTLVVDGTMGGTLNVGGTLAGSGTVPALTVQPNGLIAPGHSIGTMTVAGNVTFAPGSIYRVELNSAGQSDKINATGMATINGGTVQAVPFPNYALNTQYTILTAAGGRTGAFDQATWGGNSAFIVPQLSYDANNVYLRLIQVMGFTDLAATPNQQATASGAQSLGPGNAIFDAISQLGATDEAQRAYDQLSGEIHASLKTALLDDSQFLRDAAINRVRSAFNGVAASVMPIMSYGPGGLAAAPATTEGLAVWGQAFGAWGRWNGNGNATMLSRSTGGFFLGGDASIGDAWRLGLAGGYSRTSFSADARASSGTSDNYHVGTFAGAQWGQVGLRVGGAYTWHDIDTARSVAFTGFSDQLVADYNGGTAQVFGELGYRLHAPVARFEPFAGIAYANLRTDSFTERGGAAALTSAASNTDTTFTTLGVRADRQLAVGAASLTARSMIGWRHAFDDAAPTSMLSFAGSSNFLITAVPIARDAAIVDAGLETDVASGASLGLTYTGQIAAQAASHAVRARFGLRF